MCVRYDFDILWLVPCEVEADPAFADLLADLLAGLGRGDLGLGAGIAVFRDPAVLEQIEAADPGLRALLTASGFGFSPSGRKLPPGRYASEDAPLRAEVIARLGAALAEGALDGLDLAGFDPPALLHAAAVARPLPRDDTGAEALPAPHSAPRFTATATAGPEPIGAFGASRHPVLNLIAVALLIALFVLLFAGRSPSL